MVLTMPLLRNPTCVSSPAKRVPMPPSCQYEITATHLGSLQLRGGGLRLCGHKIGVVAVVRAGSEYKQYQETEEDRLHEQPSPYEYRRDSEVTWLKRGL
jgi:hypothetical protein